MALCIFIFFIFNAALQITPDQAKAYEFYKKNSLSIEIIKDDVLQKVNFRVKNKVWNYLQISVISLI